MVGNNSADSFGDLAQRNINLFGANLNKLGVTTMSLDSTQVPIGSVYGRFNQITIDTANGELSLNIQGTEHKVSPFDNPICGAPSIVPRVEFLCEFFEAIQRVQNLSGRNFRNDTRLIEQQAEYLRDISGGLRDIMVAYRSHPRAVERFFSPDEEEAIVPVTALSANSFAQALRGFTQRVDELYRPMMELIALEPLAKVRNHISQVKHHMFVCYQELNEEAARIVDPLADAIQERLGILRNIDQKAFCAV